MQPLGYYGLKLDISTEIEIDNLALHQLVDILDDASRMLYGKHYVDNKDVPTIRESEKPIDATMLSDSEAIGFIRAMCDRIEDKLRQETK